MQLKTKKLADGKYALVGTGLVIQRGLPPRYREYQEWYVTPADDCDRILIIGKGKADAVGRVETILEMTEGLNNGTA